MTYKRIFGRIASLTAWGFVAFMSGRLLICSACREPSRSGRRLAYSRSNPPQRIVSRPGPYPLSSLGVSIPNQTLSRGTVIKYVWTNQGILNMIIDVAFNGAQYEARFLRLRDGLWYDPDTRSFGPDVPRRAVPYKPLDRPWAGSPGGGPALVGTYALSLDMPESVFGNNDIIFVLIFAAGSAEPIDGIYLLVNESSPVDTKKFHYVPSSPDPAAPGAPFSGWVYFYPPTT